MPWWKKILVAWSTCHYHATFLSHNIKLGWYILIPSVLEIWNFGRVSMGWTWMGPGMWLGHFYTQGEIRETVRQLQTNQGEKSKWKKYKENNFNTQEAATNTSNNNGDKEFPPCKHSSRIGHPPFKCWRRPDVKCEKCNKLRHHVRICKSNFQQKNVAQVAYQQEEEQLFVATCFTSNSSCECWLVDNGCTNHMTHD